MYFNILAYLTKCTAELLSRHSLFCIKRIVNVIVNNML